MIKNRNYSLDLLRVIACYLVIQQHASEFYYIGEGGTVVTGDNTFWIGIITTLCRHARHVRHQQRFFPTVPSSIRRFKYNDHRSGTSLRKRRENTRFSQRKRTILTTVIGEKLRFDYSIKFITNIS